MKKFFAALLCGMMLLGSSLTFAAVDDSKIALGSIYPGMSANDILNAFGQPNYRDDDDLHYQNFTVEIEHGIVEKVTTYSDTLATPGGVRVGMSANARTSTYGRADRTDYDDGGVEYEYYGMGSAKKIEFKVMNGVITKITCKLRD